MPDGNLTIALSKGRILDEALPLLRSTGIAPVEDLNSTRRLIVDTNRDEVKLVLVRASDVPTFVEYGAADLGVAGKDILLEHEGEGLYELLDLGIARCRLMVALRRDSESLPRRPRIATKYTLTTRKYFAAQGKQVEVIKLYGSMELAPLVGLAQGIVDVVDTGNTLRANGLEPREHIVDVSSRLIANRGSMKMKHAQMKSLVAGLAAAVARPQVR